MHRNLLYLLGLAMTIGVVAADSACADLVAYYPFDEGQGTVARDASGNSHDGTLQGNVTWIKPGQSGTAAIHTGANGDVVNIGTWNPSEGTNELTLAIWVRWAGEGAAHQGLFGKRQGWSEDGSTVMWFLETTPDGRLAFRTRSSAINATGALNPYIGEWVHAAVTHDGSTARIYVNAQQVGTGTITFNTTSADVAMSIGCVSVTNNEVFNGDLDEARIYDEVLEGPELIAAMEGTPPENAYAPQPLHGAVHEETWVLLKWKPGAYAVAHDVYLGTSFEDVNQAAEGTFLGNTGETSMTVGAQNRPLPEGLQPGTTYYWRVDEVNEDDAGSPWRGKVWSFWLPPRTAYAPSPADGVSYVLPNAQLGWSPGFKAIFRTVYFDTDASLVANASSPLFQLETTYDPGPLEPATTYYWRVDEFDGKAWWKGPLWSFATLPEIAVSDPHLAGWWKLDEGAGTTAVDWSGHGNHGTLFGPSWTIPGWIGEAALDFRATDSSYVAIDNLHYNSNDIAEITVCAWVRTSSGADQYIVSFDRSEYYRLAINTEVATAGQVGWHVMTSTGQVDYSSVTRIDDGQWHHVCGVFDNGVSTIYIDGAPEPSASGGPVMGTGNTRYGFLGANSETAAFNGTRGSGAPVVGNLDDVRIYDKALTAEEIRDVMRGDPLLAWDFQPPNGAIVDIRDIVSLTWRPGDLAAEHDVYLGTDFDAVYGAGVADASGVYRGRQAGTTYVPPEDFAWGQICYWRIDEINTDGTVAKGGVQSFTVADFLPVEDFESYTEDFEAGEAIFQTWIDGIENNTGSTVGYWEAADGTFGERTIVHGGTQSMPVEYNNVYAPYYSEAERTWTSPQDWTAEGATHLSLWLRGNPVRFVESADTITMSAAGTDIWGMADEFTFAYKQLTGDGSVAVRVDSIENTNAWAKAGVMIRDSLDPSAKNAMAYVTPDGRVGWQFREIIASTSDSTRSDPGAVACPHWVRLTRTGNVIKAEHSDDGTTWEPMVEVANPTEPTSREIPMGSTVFIGLALTSHSAGVVNTAEFFGATTTAPGPWQFVEIGVDHALNDPASLYVAIEDNGRRTGVSVHPDPNAVCTTQWAQWDIPLSDFALAGVNVAAVKTMYIGVGDRTNPTPDGAGRIYIDDIALTQRAPAVEPNDVPAP